MKKISFNHPIAPKFSNIFKKLNKENRYSSSGKFSYLCETWLKKNIKCKESLVVGSCTAALEMCAILLNIKKNDEVIMPSYTFVSTANAFALRGGKPVFVDIDKFTCNIDPNKIEKAINKKTKAIIVVHYAGVSCDMDPIIKIAKKYNLYVIEDAAQAILSKYKNKNLGSIGDLATISFHETKNIHCGKGGALLINNPKFIKRAKIIKDKGTNRDLFNRNLLKKYTWVDYGSSYGLSEINCAILYSQLKKAKQINKQRLLIFKHYHNKLKKLENNNLIIRPTIPKHCENNGHIYYIILKKRLRNKLISYLKNYNIYTTFHYIPLHQSPFGRKKGKKSCKMNVTNFVSQNLIRLPMHSKLDKNEINKISNTIYKFFIKYA